MGKFSPFHRNNSVLFGLNIRPIPRLGSHRSKRIKHGGAGFNISRVYGSTKLFLSSTCSLPVSPRFSPNLSTSALCSAVCRGSGLLKYILSRHCDLKASLVLILRTSMLNAKELTLFNKL